MSKRMNALDWFHEKFCSQCDRPIDECKEGRGQEIACLLAHLLRALTAE